MTTEDQHKLMKSQQYKCTCGNVITMDNYMPHETPLPAMPCARCRGGQGLPLDQQLYNRKGLMAVGEATLHEI